MTLGCFQKLGTRPIYGNFNGWIWWLMSGFGYTDTPFLDKPIISNADHLLIARSEEVFSFSLQNSWDVLATGQLTVVYIPTSQ